MVKGGIGRFGKKKSAPFELIINLPKPRYERNIITRDEYGRIIHSQPPAPRI